MKRTGSGFIAWMTRSVVVSVLTLLLGGLSVTSATAAAFPIATGGAAMSAAFDGTHYLVGVENHLTNPTSIGAQMLNADGTKFGSLIPTGRTGIATNVAFDGTNFLLIWEDNASGLQIYGLFINTSGVAVGSPFSISNNDINFDGIKTMAFGGGKYLVTYTKLIGGSSSNRVIYGKIVNPNGTMGSEFPISTGNGKASDVAFDGTNFFVIWREDQLDMAVRGRFVSPAGVPGTEISVNASVAPSDNPMSVTYDGTNYLVVWNDEVSAVTNNWDVFGQLVSPGGTLVGGVIPITTEPGQQMVTSVAFDGSNYLAVWVDIQNGTNWDVYGQYLSRNGSLVGSKITISNAATNQMGGVGFANGKYLALINNGVTMGPGGISAVSDASGMFITPPTDQFKGSGTYTYSGVTPNGTLSWTWTDLNFICNGPQIGPGTQTITVLDATTLTWTDSGGGMTWNRPSGTTGDITGTWTATDSGSGNSYTLVFTGTAASGSVSVTADIIHCGTNGPPSITSFSPGSGTVGSRVLINGSNFSPLATENTVTFNGLPAVVIGVLAGQISVLVPPGATTGTISITNPGGTVTTATSFTVIAGAPAATLSWGGVHHRIDSDGIEYDALDAGINSYASTLFGMTLTVSGPSGFSYTFTDADINTSVLGQLAVYKKYFTPGTSLQKGDYTFTLNDGQGHISHRVDTHVTVIGPAPQVDSATIQLQRNADGSYRISWAPLNDTKTYYYRVRIFRNDTANTHVYNGTRSMVAFVDLPTGILFDDSTYKVRVEACDSSDNDLTTNRSDSAWKLFSPQMSDYNPNRLPTNFSVVFNRTDGAGIMTFDAVLGVSDPTKVTSITLTGPAGFTPYNFNIAADVSYRTNDGTTVITDFYKNFPTVTTMPAGLYTFTYKTALGGTQTAYATLTAPVTYPLVNSTTLQAQDLGSGNIRFSWASVNYTGALYYRVVLNNQTKGQTKGLSYNSGRLNQTFVDIPANTVTNLAPNRWRVEVYDSSDITTVRNRFNTSPWTNLSTQTYDAAKPLINKFRIRNMTSASGAAYSHISVDASGSQSTLNQILVTGPGGYSHNLLAEGRYSPVYGAYTLEVPGTLATGLYTIAATNGVGSTTRYMYVPAANALPRPDYTTFHNDLEPNGDKRFSWAPVVSTVPVWYSFSVYAQSDQNNDGLMDVIYFYTLNGTNNIQQSSILVSAATVASWPQPYLAQVMAYDGSNYSVISNFSQSAMVDVIGNPVADPFSAGNDGLATAVTGTYPVNGAAGIPPNGSSISVVFNKVIDQRSLPASFTLNNGVTGTVSYNPATRTATLTPSASLQSGTTYTATISTALHDQAGNALSTPYSWSFTTAGSLPSLAVTIIGNGNVNSNTGSPGIHGASPGIYTSPYAWNTPVTLTATTQTGWDFSGWTGACTANLLTCTLTMDAPTKNVTASFTVQQNIKNGSNYFGTLISALQPASVVNNDILLIKSLTFVETPVYNVPGVSITLKGGYIDPGFSNNSGANSLVDGSLKIRGGAVRVQKITVK